MTLSQFRYTNHKQEVGKRLYLVQSGLYGESKRILGLFSTVRTALAAVRAVEETGGECEVIRLTVDGGQPWAEDHLPNTENGCA